MLVLFILVPVYDLTCIITGMVNNCINLLYPADCESDTGGRIGPETVKFDVTGNSGTLIVESDKLGVG